MSEKCPNLATCSKALYAQGTLEDANKQNIEIRNQGQLEGLVQAARSIGSCATGGCPMGIEQK